ncbi:hypothetical protein GGS20DRAFT_146399 [Poronia punctata]|nr:hypothetical protein GGS20DRAFT_146399 [Poronia punctata]
MLPIFATFITLTLALAAEPCAKAPSWTFQNLNITTRDEVGETGTASFGFTYNLSNQTDSVTCPLHSNYRCTITGTRSDNSTIIDLQLGLGTVYLTVFEVLGCGTTFVGNSELKVDCDTVPFGAHTCTAGGATIQGVAGG